MATPIPFLPDTDILILGGSSGAVEAAVAARNAGARVFLATAWTYPGEDVCATLRSWLDADQRPATALAESLFGAALASGSVPAPTQVKRGLEQALVQAGANYLYMSAPVYLLRDSAGKVAGAVLANRSGYQAVRAKVVVDATERAAAARLTGAAFRPFVPGEYPVRWRVLGVGAAEFPAGAVTELPGVAKIEDRECRAVEHRLNVLLPDLSPASWARMHTQAATRTWNAKQLTGADRPDLRLADRLVSRVPQQEWHGAAAFDLAATQCGAEPVFVLGPLADVSDAVAEALARPCNLMALGQRLGQHAAAVAAKTAPAAAAPAVDYRGLAPVSGVEVCRRDRYFRYAGAPGLDLDLNRLPVLGNYDVVVVGGGTAGAPAGIAAARAGAKTLIVETLAGLGGVGTEGRICSYYHGNRVGFTAEIGRGLAELGQDPKFGPTANSWNPEVRRQWYLREALAAGAEVWFGVLTVAAAVAGNKVSGIVVATPCGYGLLLAKEVVDASGNADVAAAAGAKVVNVEKEHLAVQGTGLSPSIPGRHYTNTDHTFVDDTDVIDVTRAFTLARQKFRGAFDLSQIVNSRQRQQIVGDYTLDPLDFLAHRSFPDTITTARSNFDSHGFTIHPVFMAKAPDKESIDAHVPYRCLLPAGLEGVLVTGLGVSCHRDALPVVRMQPDVQNQGYAAGRAAALAALQALPLRGIDIKALQRHLVEIGILAAEVPAQEDSFPLPRVELEKAVAEGLDEYLGLAVIFAHPEPCRELLRQALASATTPERRVRCAHLLGLLRDDAGVAVLAAAVDAQGWDKGWNYTGMSQFGFSLSPLDSQLVALGRTGNRLAQPALLRKLKSLAPEQEFSHCRALALAFEALPGPAAAPEFARVLAPLAGNSRSSVQQGLANLPDDGCDTSERNRELKELYLARGLYACGDHQGLAERVLRAYAQDYHGHYARHARAILG